MFDLKNQEDYCIFLLVHLGSADGSFHPSEADAILAGISKIFPSLNVKVKLAEAQQVWRELGFANANAAVEGELDLLRSLGIEQRKALYAILFDVINADGKVNEAETSFLRKVKAYLLE